MRPLNCPSFELCKCPCIPQFHLWGVLQKSKMCWGTHIANCRDERTHLKCLVADVTSWHTATSISGARIKTHHHYCNPKQMVEVALSQPTSLPPLPERRIMGPPRRWPPIRKEDSCPPGFLPKNRQCCPHFILFPGSMVLADGHAKVFCLQGWYLMKISLSRHFMALVGLKQGHRCLGMWWGNCTGAERYAPHQ